MSRRDYFFSEMQRVASETDQSPQEVIDDLTRNWANLLYVEPLVAVAFLQTCHLVGHEEILKLMRDHLEERFGGPEGLEREVHRRQDNK